MIRIGYALHVTRCWEILYQYNIENKDLPQKPSRTGGGVGRKEI